MYEFYFNLRERPFASAPRIDHYFPAAGIEAARGTLVRCVQRAEGVGMVIGPPGTGKTLLCHLLADHLKQGFQVALLASGRLSSRRALLQAILYEFGLPYRGMDEGELQLALADHVTLSDDCPQGAVVLVDESHVLPMRLLDELRMLTNLTREGQAAVRLVLTGNRDLEERLASPKLESFSQRVTARCYLEPLNRCETQDYIHARITAVGGRAAEIFPSGACQGVYKATEGVPRLVNQVCDHAMLLAYAAGRKCIGPAEVDEAWADLQQLPAPWSPPCPEPASGGVIEFGRLDDEPVQAETGPQREPAGQPESSLPSLRISPQSEDPGRTDWQSVSQDGETDGQTVPLRGEPPKPPDAEPAEQIHHIQEMLADAEEEFQPVGSIGPEVELVFDEADPFRETFEKEEVIADRYAPPPAEDEPAPADAGQEAASAPRHAGPPAAAGQHEVESQTVPMRRATTAKLPGPDDTDMVVVEESYEDTPPWPVRSVIPVRRHEYGRLFARLRRG